MAAALVSWPVFPAASLLVVVLCIYASLTCYRHKYGTWRYWNEAGCLAYRPMARCPQCGHLQKLPDDTALAETACELCGDTLCQE